jgi:tRNA G18 (ribose-2'-O)-methylase SpoU
MTLQPLLLVLSSTLPLRPLTLSDAHVRYCYEGGTFRRDGRLCALPGVAPTGAQVLAALSADGADLARFTPRAYDEKLSGWAPLTADTRFEPAADGSECRRVDVTLFRKKPTPPSNDFDGEHATAAGYFTCGVVGAKHGHNLGTLWRSAYQLGAAGIFVVAERGAAGSLHKEAADTTKAWRRIPMCQHEDWNAFAAAQPLGALLVAVEMGGEDTLDTFEHPERAVYLLGAEDTGLPESVVRACHRHVTLPCERYESFNVAVAGSLVMYDRLAKLRQRLKAAEEARPQAVEAGRGAAQGAAAHGEPHDAEGSSTPRPRRNMFVTRKGGRSRSQRRLR